MNERNDETLTFNKKKYPESFIKLRLKLLIYCFLTFPDITKIFITLIQSFYHNLSYIYFLKSKVLNESFFKFSLHDFLVYGKKQLMFIYKYI